MENFKYDLMTLFKLIEERPCIWDKRSNCRVLRDKSWIEISRILDGTYDSRTADEKKKIGITIRRKWENVRDAFVRSLNSKNGRTAKKYLYADSLQFLLDPSGPGGKRSNIRQTNYSSEESGNETYSCNGNAVHNPVPPYNLPDQKCIEMKRELNDIEANLPELKKCKTQEQFPNTSTSIQNKELSFFTSFSPYVTDMTEDEKLDLHMEIISAIKRIKEKRIHPRALTESVGAYAACDVPVSKTRRNRSENAWKEENLYRFVMNQYGIES